MPRTARQAPGGMVFHVMNRGVGRMRLFEKAADYVVYEQVSAETLESCPFRKTNPLYACPVICFDRE